MPKQPITAKFPPYAPDRSNLMTGVSTLIQNVFPRYDGYGPVPSLIDFTQSLPGTCRGLFFARNSDGSITVFGATATNLYVLNNTNFSWTNVSLGGGPYASVTIDRNWEFVQFNNVVICVQQNVAPQSFVLGSSTAFANLGGSPPQAGNVAVIGFFVVLTELLGNPKRVQWSDLSGITTWTAGVGLSDFQDLSDGGNCHVCTGGDAFGVLFQDSAVRSFTYAPGSPNVFQIFRIGTNESLEGRYSIITVGPITYYHGANGFKQIVNGAPPTPIGKGFVDDTFIADWDASNLRLLFASNDPNNTRIYWAYKSLAGQAGLLDKILVYDPAIGQNGSWSLIVGQNLEILTALAKPGLTLENMDAFGLGAISVTTAGNNGSGNVRLTLNPGVTNGPFTLVGQNIIEVQNVVGTTEANGGWQLQAGTGNPSPGRFTIVDSTHIDLGVAFVHAYVSGGAIGGSLDTISFSFDNLSSNPVAQLAASDSTHAVGFFSGPNLTATVETDEEDYGGNLIMLNGMRPYTDCPTAQGCFGQRATPDQVSVVYGALASKDAAGKIDQMVEARYLRAQIQCPAGASWKYIRAVQLIDANEAGEY